MRHSVAPWGWARTTSSPGRSSCASATRPWKSALSDELTGLGNRRYAMDFLHQKLGPNKAQAMAVVVIDIDHFKAVNDHFGHAGSDLVLRDFAACLAETADRDDMVARIGGEEFLLVMQGARTLGAAASSSAQRASRPATGIPAQATLPERISRGGRPDRWARCGRTALPRAVPGRRCHRLRPPRCRPRGRSCRADSPWWCHRRN